MDQDVTHLAGSKCHPSIRLHKRSEAGEGDTECIQRLLRHLGVKIVGYLV
jgi:hypothetical protein